MSWTTTQVTAPAHRIDLGIGQPDPALLPADLFQQVSLEAPALAYGTEAGDERFRSALATWLNRRQTQPASAGNLLVTNGSSNALDMICTRFSQPGDTVLVEDPTYFIARRQLSDHGLTTIAVPMDENGVDILELAALIDQHKPAFFYTIPTFHNPTGITQSTERRAQLVALARDTGCPVVADEVYQYLYYDQPPPDPLASFDDRAPILSIGSFSKLLAPGLRLGWIQAPQAMLAPLIGSGLLASGGGLAPVTSSLVRPLLEDGRFDHHLSRLSDIYRRRLATLVQGLTDHLDDRLEWTTPKGGFFMWTHWRNGADTDAMLLRAHEVGVGFQPGQKFSASPEQASAMRLCFAFYDEAKLTQACERLSRL
ncbi:PLP-dependent aminotransferase family protein [Saccharospirillum impatiens]|uniref:aminotransferase-like domain-containing protein n=1 Tax=Saccharospirillum impatiens TaxID=169438 RepID=UPI0004204EA6|nr:PLP-dependent aminotransferase family protein [Saccharospirillum impatiens]